MEVPPPPPKRGKKNRLTKKINISLKLILYFKMVFASLLFLLSRVLSNQYLYNTIASHVMFFSFVNYVFVFKTYLLTYYIQGDH